MIWHVGLLHKVKSYGISGQIFGFISSFLSYRLLLVVVDESLHKNIQLMLDFLSFLFLVLHFSFYILMTFMMILFVILLSILLVLLSTLNMVRHLICGNNQNWLLNLNLIYLTLDWSRKWLIDFNAGKIQLVLFDQSNNTGSIDLELDGSVLEQKSSKSSKLDWGSYIISIGKTASKKSGTLICSMKFLSPEVAVSL